MSEGNPLEPRRSLGRDLPGGGRHLVSVPSPASDYLKALPFRVRRQDPPVARISVVYAKTALGRGQNVRSGDETPTPARSLSPLTPCEASRLDANLPRKHKTLRHSLAGPLTGMVMACPLPCQVPGSRSYSALARAFERGRGNHAQHPDLLG